MRKYYSNIRSLLACDIKRWLYEQSDVEKKLFLFDRKELANIKPSIFFPCCLGVFLAASDPVIEHLISHEIDLGGQKLLVKANSNEN